MPEPHNIFFDLSDLAELGLNAIVGKTVRVRRPASVRVKRNSIIDDFTYISCALEVGEYTHIGASTTIIGGDATVVIGDFVNLAPGCRLVAASNDYTGGGLVGAAIPPEFSGDPVVGQIAISDHVLLGTGTVILPGVSLPEGLSTGALTLVSAGMELEPWTLYVGTPARAVKKRDPTMILEAAQRVRAENR